MLPFDQERRVRALAKNAAIGLDHSRAWLATPATQDLFARLDRGQADERDLADALGEVYGRPVSAAEAKALVLSVFEDPDLKLWTLTARLRIHCAVGGFSDNPDFVQEVFPAGHGLDPLFLSCRLGLTKSSQGAFAAVQAQLAPRPIRFCLSMTWRPTSSWRAARGGRPSTMSDPGV